MGRKIIRILRKILVTTTILNMFFNPTVLLAIADYAESKEYENLDFQQTELEEKSEPEDNNSFEDELTGEVEAKDSGNEQNNLEYTQEYLKYMQASEEEKMLYGDIPPKYGVPFNESNSSDEEIEAKAQSIPSSYMINGLRVEDQSGTGWCWAYASLKSFETYLMKMYGKNNNSSYDFSEAHLAYSRYKEFGGDQTALNYWKEDNVTKYGSYGEVVRHTGGNFYDFMDYAGVTYKNTSDEYSILGPVKQSIIPNNKDYGYTFNTYNYSLFKNATKEYKIKKTRIFSDIQKDYTRKNGYVYATYKDIFGNVLSDSKIKEYRNSIKSHIMQYGGLYGHTHCDTNLNYYNNSTNALFMCNSQYSYNHAVCIIGWNDNYSRDNFNSYNRPATDGAWIALNSWGSDWGIGGYFYISYEDMNIDKGMCGFLDADIYNRSPKLDIKYSTTNYTNKDVTVTISSANKLVKPDDSWSVINFGLEDTDYGEIRKTETSLTKKYTTNSKEEIIVKDKSGAYTKEVINVSNIDKTGPSIYRIKMNRNSKQYDKSVEVTLEGITDGNNGAGLRTDKLSYSYSYDKEKGYQWTQSNKYIYTTAGTKYIYLRDKLGNIKKLSVNLDDYIDNEGPTAKITLDAVGEEYKKNVTATVTKVTDTKVGLRNDNLTYCYTYNETKKYEWTSESKYVYTTNGDKKICVRDALGNITEYSIKINNIDQNKPEYTKIKKNTSNWAKEVTITVEGLKDDKRLAKEPYSYDKGTTWKTEATNKYDSNGEKEIYLRDYAGNITKTSVNIDNIDKTLPTINNIKIEDNIVKATIKDSQSQIDSYRWTIGQNKSKPIKDYGWKTLSGKEKEVSIDLNKYPGETVYLYARDKVGNERCQVIYNKTFKIESLGKKDNIIQYKITSNVEAEINVSLIKELIENTKKSDFKVKKLEAKGTKNFILEIECPKDNKSKGKIILKNGIIYQKSTNSSLYNTEITLEVNNSTKPTIEIGEIKSEITKNPISIDITAEDNDSGISKILIIKNGAKYLEKSFNSDLSSSITVNNLKNGNYIVKAYDVDGNVAEKSFIINNVDQLAPNITKVTKSTENPTNQNVVLTVVANDSGSGIQGYSFDGGKTWQNGNTKEYSKFTSGIVIKVKDKAGNIATYSKTIDITNIEKSALKVKKQEGKKGKNLKIVEVYSPSGRKLKLTNDLKANGWMLINGKKSIIKFFNENTTSDGEKITVTDIYGNKTDQTINVNDINRSSPKIIGTRISESSSKGYKYSLTINTQNEGESLEYSFDGGRTWQTNNTKEYKRITNNVNVCVKNSIDNVSKIKIPTVNIEEIEATEPIVSDEPQNSNLGDLRINPQVSFNEDKTNKSVEVTIKTNKEVILPDNTDGWTLSEDDKTIKKVFTDNSYEVLNIINKDYSYYSEDVEISITNIDKEAPELEWYYGSVNEQNSKSTVKAVANEEIKQIEGWTLSDDKRIISREIGKEEIENGISLTIEDLAGNVTEVTLKKDISKDDNEDSELKYSISQTVSDKLITVVIQFSTKMQLAEGMTGWNVSDDGMSISKIYEENQIDSVNVVNPENTDEEKKIGIDVNALKITGDINNDGKINIIDLLFIQRHVKSRNKPDWELKDERFKLADMNKDGQVNIIDLLMLKRAIK